MYQLLLRKEGVFESGSVFPTSGSTTNNTLRCSLSLSLSLSLSEDRQTAHYVHRRSTEVSATSFVRGGKKKHLGTSSGDQLTVVKRPLLFEALLVEELKWKWIEKRKKK
jgi:hypothetical protein